MDINKIKENIGAFIGKPKGIVTRSYNEIKRQKDEEGLGALGLPEDQFQRVVLLGVLKKFEIPSDKLDEFIEDLPTEAEMIADLGIGDEISEAIAEVEEEPVGTSPRYRKAIMTETGFTRSKLDDLVDAKKAELKGLVSEEGALFIITKELGVGSELTKKDKEDWKNVVKNTVVESDDWKSFLGSLPEKEGSIMKMPSIILKENISYLLKIDTTQEPYHHHQPAAENKYGKDYDSWKFVVTLIKVKDEDSYDDIYEKGDNKGDLLYVDGQKYALWFTHDPNKWSPMDTFAQFWTDTLGLADFDGRIFGVKKFKKMSKKGRSYTTFKFFQVEGE